MSKAATLELFAGITPDGLTGGAQWYDYQMVESDRLTIAFAAAADRAGAELANYAEAIEALTRGRPDRRDARQRHAHRTRPSRSRRASTLNAAGSRAGDVMAMFGVSRPFPLRQGDEPGDVEAGERHGACRARPRTGAC